MKWFLANGTHAETCALKEWRDDYQTLAAGLFHCFFDIPQQETFSILNAVSFLVESFFRSLSSIALSSFLWILPQMY